MLVLPGSAGEWIRCLAIFVAPSSQSTAFRGTTRDAGRSMAAHVWRKDMGLAEYMIVAQGDEWGVLHDGNVRNRCHQGGCL